MDSIDLTYLRSVGWSMLIWSESEFYRILRHLKRRIYPIHLSTLCISYPCHQPLHEFLNLQNKRWDASVTTLGMAYKQRLCVNTNLVAQHCLRVLAAQCQNNHLLVDLLQSYHKCIQDPMIRPSINCTVPTGTSNIESSLI